MRIWTQKWRNAFKDKNFVTSFIFGFLFLFISFYINFVAGTYATERASLPVTDIVLSNIRVFDVDAIFLYGPLILWAFLAIVFIYNPKKIPFSLKSIALFVIIRSLFISLTHLGPFPTQAVISTSDFLSKFTFGGDLFFSGHTGLPFLMALIFWDNKIMRYILLVSSVIFGVVVLLGHLHYSIDVLAAFFITYTIFHISLLLFKKEREMFFN